MGLWGLKLEFWGLSEGLRGPEFASLIANVVRVICFEDYQAGCVLTGGLLETHYLALIDPIIVEII